MKRYPPIMGGSDLMWSGGPQQFQDRYPVLWAVFPQFMRDPLLPRETPLSPYAMTLTCAALMGIPVIGYVAAVSLGEYQLYYAAGYAASPPGSYTDVPISPDSGGEWVPAAEANVDLDVLIRLVWTDLVAMHGDVLLTKAGVNLILDRLPGGTTPPIVASSVDTARILAGVYYLAQLPFAVSATIDDTAILAAIEDAVGSVNTNVDAVDINIGGVATNIQNRFDSVDAAISALGSTIGGWIDAAVVAINAVTNAIESTLAGIIGAAKDEILAALPGEGGTAGAPVWPGLSGVTLSSPVSVTGPTVITEAMDGLIFAVVTTPPGQSIQPASGHTRYKGLAWCAFLSDGGDAEAKQPLEVGDGVICPKNMLQAAAVVVYCKPGANIQVTPWTITL